MTKNELLKREITVFKNRIINTEGAILTEQSLIDRSNEAISIYKKSIEESETIIQALESQLEPEEAKK